jgi:hypothetical protein
VNLDQFNAYNLLIVACRGILINCSLSYHTLRMNPLYCHVVQAWCIVNLKLTYQRHEFRQQYLSLNLDTFSASEKSAARIEMPIQKRRIIET